MTDKPKIGFIGLGNMGAPMARCLLRNGYCLVLYDIRRAAVDALAGEAAAISAARGPSEVGQSCRVAITMLPDSAAVREAVLGGDGRGGLAQGMGRGSVLVDMSSSVPTATRSLGEELRNRGLDLVDAPVSGGVPRAVDGTLTIMAGGEQDTVDSVEPILSCMGTVHRTGALGSGHAAKALNNFVSAAGLIAVSEALVIAERFGLDPHVLNGVLNVSTGRNNTTDRKVAQYMLSRAFDSGFALDLMRKDLGIAQGLAADLGLDASCLNACKELFEQASRELGADADHTAAFAFIEQTLIGGAKRRRSRTGEPQE